MPRRSNFAISDGKVTKKYREDKTFCVIMLISSLSESLRLFVEIAEAADGYEQTLYIIPGGITPLETEAMQHVTRVVVVALYDNSFLAVGYILI
jgi:hypothetical protein